ncbi:dihydrofolate reductase family protein [Actinoallomurus oryzae]|uniref:dihydrofolate reductase family protein n=1 Tax=Actinoallomurus oryzae TaxID=502180 RepID=UPI003CD06FEE
MASLPRTERACQSEVGALQSGNSPRRTRSRGRRSPGSRRRSRGDGSSPAPDARPRGSGPGSSPIWNARLLEGDVPERVAELKRELPGNLLSYGFGEPAHGLARHGLVDEVRFWLHPVVWGEGLRPIENGRSPVRMRLIGARRSAPGSCCCRTSLLAAEPAFDWRG